MNTPTLRNWLGLIGLSLMASIAFLDFTIVYTALPALQQHFQAPVISLQWVMNIFSLALATLMIFSGKLADIFGKRRLFYIGVILFGLAAIGAGLSINFDWLIVFRGLQGVASAIIFTSAGALAPTCVPPEKQTRAIGVYSSITGFGLSIGPFVGGLLISWLSWRWIFFINIPLVLIGFALCLNNVKEMPKQPDIKIDWWGFILMLVGFSSLLYTITQVGSRGWLQPITLIGFAIAIICLFALFIVEARVKHPLLNIQDIRHPKVLLSMVLCIIASVMTSGMLFLAPLYLTNILNVSSIVMGLLMLCTPIVQVVMSALWDKIHHAFGVYQPMIIAIVTVLISAVIQLSFGTNTSLWLIVFAFLLMGLIWGTCNTAVLTLTYQAVASERTSGVLGLIFTNWNSFGTLLMALTSTIFTTTEFRQMQHYLSMHHVFLSVQEHRSISTMLSNPSEAHSILHGLIGQSADKLLPLFQTAFMHGFHSCQLFFVILFILGLATTTVLIKKSRAQA